MSLVQDPPRPAPDSAASNGPDRQPAWPDPQQGVIEEARRRQQRRRTRLAIAATVAVGLIAIVTLLIEASHASDAHTGSAGPGAAAGHASSEAASFDVRMAPTLEVGQAGWNLFYEEHGAQAGGESVGPALRSDPIFASDGAGDPHQSITNVLTTSNVASVLIDGKTRVPTVPLPGLPYGYRAVHFVTKLTPAEERAPAEFRTQGSSSPVPFDSEGQPIHYKGNNLDPSQGTVHPWEYPAPTPEGACGLRASDLPGLTARSGRALSGVRPYPAARVGGQIAGHAFLPCVSVLYQLHGTPLQALILLDAAHPGTRPAALPDFEPVRGAPGIFDQGGLTARREGGGWLIVGQGRGVAQRVDLLRHLHALVKLGSLIPASAGVPEVGEADAPPPPVRAVKVSVLPALQAGELGWEYLQTEAHAGGSGSCCSALTQPAQLLGASKDIGSGPWWTATAITAPDVASVSVEGRPPVPTRSGGLPYGLRFATLPVKNDSVKPVAFDARGQRIAVKGVEPQPKRHEFEGPYAPHAWTAPSAPSTGVCEISASAGSGLSAVGGGVVWQVKGYPVYESRTFQSCADTYYTLGKSTLEAAVLLDAEHPGAKPAALPYMRPAASASGVFDARAAFMRGARNLTAERLPGAWLVVAGGSGPAQQLQALRRLHASVHI